MAQLAVIADDLTGAADTSACFADAGLSTVIPLFGSAHPAADVIALSTESRDMDAAAAARVTGAAVAVLCARTDGTAPRWIYKKIDSALRGHPRDELLATMEAVGATRAIVAPALPAEGRTTVGGRQYVGGIQLERSPFGGADTDSDLTAIFTNDRGLPLRLLDLQTIRNQPEAISRLLDSIADGIVLADAETDDDLLTLARAVRESRQTVLCGAAGFARQLSRMLPLVRRESVPVTIRRGAGPILIVAGSQHEATAQQIAALGQAGASIVRLSQTHVDDPLKLLDIIVNEVAHCLEAGRATVLTTSGLARSATGERSVAARLAEVATSPEVCNRFGGLVLTGGDAAAAVCAALRASALWLGGEIYAGQPWGVLDGGTLAGLPVATKAGSFGDEGALITCVDHLMSARSAT
jgi:D-threonate/D-erythronate kinase